MKQNKDKLLDILIAVHNHGFQTAKSNDGFLDRQKRFERWEEDIKALFQEQEKELLERVENEVKEIDEAEHKRINKNERSTKAKWHGWGWNAGYNYGRRKTLAALAKEIK